MTGDLELRRITPEFLRETEQLFQAFVEAREERFFSPHPFTADFASRIARHTGKDFFGVAIFNGQAIAYGLMRGWDEGYEIPSIGIGVHPEYRGRGVSLAVMHWLHAVAVLRGAERMRMRVHRDNKASRSMFEKLGYTYGPDPGAPEFMLGFFELSGRND